MVNIPQKILTCVNLRIYNIPVPRVFKFLLNYVFRVNVYEFYHTSLEVEEKEIFFGEGVKVVNKDIITNFGPPIEIIPIYTSGITFNMIIEKANKLGEKEFAPVTYNALNHNCNHFTNHFCETVFNTKIPIKCLEFTEKLKTSKVLHWLLSFVKVNTNSKEDDIPNKNS